MLSFRLITGSQSSEILEEEEECNDEMIDESEFPVSLQGGRLLR